MKLTLAPLQQDDGYRGEKGSPEDPLDYDSSSASPNQFPRQPAQARGIHVQLGQL